MAVEISVSLTDPPEIRIKDAAGEDPREVRRLVTETLARTGIRLGTFAVDAPEPDGAYRATWAQGERATMDMGGKK